MLLIYNLQCTIRNYKLSTIFFSTLIDIHGQETRKKNLLNVKKRLIADKIWKSDDEMYIKSITFATALLHNNFIFNNKVLCI